MSVEELLMCESYFRSKLLRKTMTVEDKESEGYLPCLEEDLQFFEVPECFYGMHRVVKPCHAE